MKRQRDLDILSLTASTSLIALITLNLAWELWLAPLRPGGSMLALKALPLLLPLFGILRGRRYTYQWAAMMILLYLTEGVVRGVTDSGATQLLAGLETLLALVFFISAVLYARRSAPSNAPND
ncbi:MAG: DUF2069 domain-containing protein [Rhodocyclaceae bacterium]|nr:MAG: DUF2069 domain-containing protein [Rhodocyclaceae bacterium]